MTASNVYDVRELAGAFGDLGTFIPFVLGYLTLTGLDPAGVLVPFGIAQIAVGLVHRTPLAVQPMKAVGSAAFSQASAVTAGAVQVAGLFTAAVWLLLASTGIVNRLASAVGRPVVHGLILGLGLALAVEGVRVASADPMVGVLAAVIALVLLSRAAAAMLVLLALGVGIAFVREPGLSTMVGAGLGWRMPLPAMAEIGWSDVLTGVVVLALPQVALTFGNAVLATAEENNTVFPDRPVTVRRLALNHGLMNLVAAPLGGVPMCHGAGGMAAHMRFGARTGGALVILGTVTLMAGLLFAGSIAGLMRAFPGGILGAVLVLAGLELASVVSFEGRARAERYVLLATAAVSMWHVGLGFVIGLVLWETTRRGWLRV